MPQNKWSPERPVPNPQYETLSVTVRLLLHENQSLFVLTALCMALFGRAALGTVPERVPAGWAGWVPVLRVGPAEGRGGRWGPREKGRRAHHACWDFPPAAFVGSPGPACPSRPSKTDESPGDGLAPGRDPLMHLMGGPPVHVAPLRGTGREESCVLQPLHPPPRAKFCFWWQDCISTPGGLLPMPPLPSAHLPSGASECLHPSCS